MGGKGQCIKASYSCLGLKHEGKLGEKGGRGWTEGGAVVKVVGHGNEGGEGTFGGPKTHAMRCGNCITVCGGQANFLKNSRLGQKNRKMGKN